jgi:hypothetical protein
MMVPADDAAAVGPLLGDIFVDIFTPLRFESLLVLSPLISLNSRDVWREISPLTGVFPPSPAERKRKKDFFFTLSIIGEEMEKEYLPSILEGRIQKILILCCHFLGHYRGGNVSCRH